MLIGSCVDCREIEGISWWLGLYLTLIPDFSPPLCGAQQCYLHSSLELLWVAGPGAWRIPLVRHLAAALPRVPAELPVAVLCLCLCSRGPMDWHLEIPFTPQISHSILIPQSLLPILVVSSYPFLSLPSLPLSLAVDPLPAGSQAAERGRRLPSPRVSLAVPCSPSRTQAP